MQNKPYPFPCILQILTVESLLKDFLIHLFYSQFGIITYFNNIKLSGPEVIKLFSCSTELSMKF